MPLHPFVPVIVWVILVAVMLMVRSGEPPGSWLRVRGIAKILTIATVVAIFALCVSEPI